MSITKEFLSKYNLPDEVVDAIFAERGKEISATNATIDSLTKERDGLKSNVETLTAEKEQLSKVAGDADAYKKQIEAFEKAEKERAEAAARVAEDEAITAKILSAIGDKEFTSDYVKNGILSDVKKRIAEDSTLGVDKILAELTKDKEGIFKNPNAPIKIPSAGKIDNVDDAKIREIMGLKPAKD